MKPKILFATLLTLAWFSAGSAQTLDKAKLDQFFDRLAEKNKAMGSLTISKAGRVLYTRAIGYSQISGTEKRPLTAANSASVSKVANNILGLIFCASFQFSGFGQSRQDHFSSHVCSLEDHQ